MSTQLGWEKTATTTKRRQKNDGKRVTAFVSSDLPVIHCVSVKMGEEV